MVVVLWKYYVVLRCACLFSFALAISDVSTTGSFFIKIVHSMLLTIFNYVITLYI